MIIKHSIVFCISILLLIACRRPIDEEVLPPPSVGFVFPAKFGVPNVPEHNQMEIDKINLGKVLFFDPQLSSNGKVSCASCHLPQKAFSDGVALSSAGVSGKVLPRNSQALINLAWYNEFFWDGGARSLEAQALAPLTHADEMDADLEELENHLNTSTVYQPLIKKAFEQETIRIGQVMQALAQFQRSLVSSNSYYDQREINSYTFTTLELDGLQLFENHCAGCHTPPLFTDNKYHNNGLDASFDYADPEDERWGRFRVTDNPNDIGKYRTPTLRNVALTAPYMHDGRFATLEEVIEHYNNGISSSETLAIELKEKSFQFNNYDKEAIIAFLHTLTDDAFINYDWQKN